MSEQYWNAYWGDIFATDPDNPAHGGNSHHGETNCLTPALFRYLVDRFAVRSVLDVGAGEGHALSIFRSCGIITHGIDALEANVKNARHPIAQHDLTTGPYIYPCDLVYCVEVVEHIEEEYIDNLMRTLTNAPVVAMTHALPGQPGYHHVNNQPSEYWIRLFMKWGYWVMPEVPLLRMMARREIPNSYFYRTGFVFMRSETPIPEGLAIPEYMLTPGVKGG